MQCMSCTYGIEADTILLTSMLSMPHLKLYIAISPWTMLPAIVLHLAIQASLLAA